MYANFLSPQEIMKGIAKKARSKRLELDLSQSTLSLKSGVSLGTLKNFENSGKISLESLIKIAIVLDSTEEFLNLFIQKENLPSSLDQLIKKTQKKRGRK